MSHYPLITSALNSVSESLLENNNQTEVKLAHTALDQDHTIHFLRNQLEHRFHNLPIQGRGNHFQKSLGTIPFSGTPLFLYKITSRTLEKDPPWPKKFTSFKLYN